MRRRQIEERRPAGDEKLQERQHVSLADPEEVLLLDTADAIERSPQLDRSAGCRLDESDRQARGSRQGTDSLGRSTPSDSVLLDSEPVRISHSNLAAELVKNRIVTDQTDISPGDIDAGIRVGRFLWRTCLDPVGRAVKVVQFVMAGDKQTQ